MVKRILSILISSLLAGAIFSGCSNEGTESKNESKGEKNVYEGIELTNEEVELTVWESTAGADEFVIKAGEEFTKKFPNIKIKYVNVELGDATGQIELDGPGGVGPDLFAVPNNALGILVSSGHILPAQNEEYVKENALGSCSSAVTYDGQIYGYPISADTYALFYNRALISDEEVPKNFEDLVTWCKEFQQNNPSKYGYLMNVAEGYYTYIFTTNNGNRIFGENGDDPTVTNMNTKDAIDGMKFFQSMREILNVPAGDLTTAYCDGAFIAGNVPMYLTGLWNVSNFQEAGIDFGVAAIPSLPGSDEPPASFSSARTMCVSAYSENPNEAEAFGLFMMSDEMQELRFELTGALPSVEIDVEADYIEGFLKQLDYAFPCPSITKMNDFWDPMNAASSNIWDGADVEKELDAANKAILAN